MKDFAHKLHKPREPKPWNDVAREITENLCKGIKYTGTEPLMIETEFKSKLAVINQSDNDAFSPTRNSTHG